ncbi:hypothetical protein SLEP1_g38680 [Rubroshorea leprosula]|uniref:Uncharacterized protein n=1 Tax=Rubroshorea leprosula TaxID=152421 RepID=A0AAV5KXZ8_9ROSI|nr:hypothetical protein SLEP1_g38680 [Rubroshorea leprosula]
MKELLAQASSLGQKCTLRICFRWTLYICPPNLGIYS